MSARRGIDVMTHAPNRRAARAAATAVAVVLALGAAGTLHAQRGNAQPPQSPRAAAPIDLTGYWVSLVTQDWRWRMVTPARGDYRGIPMTAAARKVADAWDPAKDEAAGEECRSYGAAAIMSVPGRVRISWQDDRTLKVETDAGMQTRLFRFGDGPRGTARSWQGVSAAEWQFSRANAPLVLRPATRPGAEDPPSTRSGSLRVVTTNLRPGYLRKNGVPYSANAVLTEYWELFRQANGSQWLTITTQVEDPQYLSQPRLIAIPFKKEPDGSKWDPTPCSARW
jgi:hypothetical protein